MSAIGDPTRLPRFYRFARIYDLGVEALPLRRRWIGRAVAHIEGLLSLEFSCGTGR
jgi:hypothetical protein